MSDLGASLAAAGIDARDVDPYKIGAWQRLRTEDKPSRKNGSVCVFESRPLRLWYCNWGTGIEGYASEDDSGFVSRDDVDAMSRAQERARREREQNQARVAEAATEIWRDAPPADPRHPYLARKQIEPHGLRQDDHKLLVPMRTGQLIWSIQAIFEDGMKRFLPGGRKSGTYYAIGSIRKHLLIAEGFATAASLHECLGLPVAVAFDAGNLIHVAATLRKKHPHASITICADNDTETEGNPGVRYATDAARACNGIVAYPDNGGPCDWNDIHVQDGAERVRELFKGTQRWTTTQR